MKNMKKCYLDANFLVFLQDRHSPLYLQAEAVLKILIEEGFALYTSALALDEFLMGSLRFSGKSAKEMKGNLKLGLKTIFRFPNFGLISPSENPEKHLKVVDLMAKFNLKPRDAYHLFIMLENKITYFATFDSDFNRVFKTGKIKPLTF